MDIRLMHRTDRDIEVAATRLAVGFCVIVLIGIALGRLVTGPLYPWATRDLDTPLRTYSIAHATVWALDAARDVSLFGSAAVTGTIAVAVGAIWAFRERNVRPALTLISAYVGALAMTVVVKYVVHRAPASGPIAAGTPGTFPSGHTLLASVVYGAIAVLVLRTHCPRSLRLAIAVPLLALPVVIAAARLYLLDHFFTDALASIALGAMWVAVTVVVVVGRAPSTR